VEDIVAEKDNGKKVQYKVGDSVDVNSKFFGRQQGEVTKIDDQSTHVRRDNKKAAEKYPHSAVTPRSGGGGGGGGMMPDLEGLKGRRPKLYKKGGKVKSASSRADGCAMRGKTRGMMK
jgi:hypothetical protein